MAIYNINGADLFVQETGTDIEGTIITLHGGRGIGDHKSDFRAYGPLGDRFRVISYDMRGHGQSSRTGPLTFNQLADDLEALRLQIVGKPIILIGGSFGGMIALTYALRHPQGISHLVLRGTAPSRDHEVGAINNLRANLHKAPSVSEEMLLRLFDGEIIDDIERRMIQFAMAPLYKTSGFDANAALEQIRTMPVYAETHNALFKDGADYDVRDRLHEIKSPTFVIVGEDDWICPRDQSELIAERIPSAELLVVKGANHGVHHESAQLVQARIREFLAR